MNLDDILQHEHIESFYLEKLFRENIAVAVYLINGIKLSGIISAYDASTLLLKDSKSTVEQLIYKHAISTVVPNKVI